MLSGVRQGTVLGPTLFHIFINDLLRCVDSAVRLFTDDCVLYREIHSMHDAAILQQDLDALNRWECLIEFNAGKCFILNITRKRNPPLIIYDLHGTALQTVSTTTYLNNDLRWTPHID